MSTKFNGNVKIQANSKIDLIIPQQSGLQQNVFGTDGLLGYFFDGFGPGKTLNDVRVNWFANGDGVHNALVVDVNVSTQKITIAPGNGLFKSGVSYRFFNTPQ